MNNLSPAGWIVLLVLLAFGWCVPVEGPAVPVNDGLATLHR